MTHHAAPAAPIPPLRPRADCGRCSHGTHDLAGYVVAYSHLNVGLGVTFTDIAYVAGSTRYAEALRLVHEARALVQSGQVAASYAVIHHVYGDGHRVS